MKCCISAESKGRKKYKKIFAGFTVLLVGVIAFLLLADGYVRSLIRGYPLSVASATVQGILDDAMSNLLAEKSTPDMSEIDKVVYDQNDNVMSIKVDTASVNYVKTEFLKRFKNIMSKKGEYFTVKIPIGTLIGDEYTMGRGPKIPFKIQFSANCKTSLKSDFSEAGINNTLHTIYLNIETYIFVVIPWDSVGKTVKTNYIIAQTVIAGKVPEAYTNVVDANGSLVDDLFDFDAEVIN